MNNQEEAEDYLRQARQEEDARQQELLAKHPDFIETAEEWRERVVLRHSK